MPGIFQPYTFQSGVFWWAAQSLIAAPLIVGSPTLGAPAASIMNVLGPAGIAPGSPVLGAPVLKHGYVLVAQHLITSPWTATYSPIVGVNILGALPLEVSGSIEFGTPELNYYVILKLADYVLDFGLEALHLEADQIFICSDEPFTYVEATSTLALGMFDVPSGVFSEPYSEADDTRGRIVKSVPVTAGVVLAAGIPQCFAIVDTANTRLLVVGPARNFVTVNVGADIWSLEPIPLVL